MNVCVSVWGGGEGEGGLYFRLVFWDLFYIWVVFIIGQMVKNVAAPKKGSKGYRTSFWASAF